MLVDRAVRRFIHDLTRTACLHAEESWKEGNQHFKMSKEHVAAAINTDTFGFMKKVVEDIPTELNIQPIKHEKRYAEPKHIDTAAAEALAKTARNYKYQGGLSYMYDENESKQESGGND